MRIVLLGGTAGATHLARILAEAGIDAVFSYAGRVEALAPQPLPTRAGGFGGAPGFARFLRDEAITHVIDATHPFAVQMSRNAVEGADAAGAQLAALERPRWTAGPGDRWTHVPDEAAAIAALPTKPSRIFLAIGRRGPAAFAARPEHWYLLRVIDPGQTRHPIPHGEVIEGRPPFDESHECRLLQEHKIDVLVAKNSGGPGIAKLAAARNLGIDVIMIERPASPDRLAFTEPEEVLSWLGHSAALGE